MINFRVEDCQAEYERLVGQGVAFIGPPGLDAIHIVATFLDPDGNMLQLMQDVVPVAELLSAAKTRAETQLT